MNHAHAYGKASSGEGPLAKTLWHLPLILAGLIGAYELELGHLAVAALAVGLLIAFQARMNKADGAGAGNARMSKQARGDGGTRAARALTTPRTAARTVLDGGSFERHQLQS
ncbi:hypothetical protein [Thiorhodococcus minor]|uniref:Uncharacterized protein n=1 Tax=Thiorhodococcus minor TaxID=57489 RepID=A0A6M0JUD6_9GAMM|nr:hypothetical protein [Thiorhodococcus minor]NEV61190.1 hypothetical protein [Thiorhodococcus minor]